MKIVINEIDLHDFEVKIILRNVKILESFNQDSNSLFDEAKITLFNELKSIEGNVRITLSRMLDGDRYSNIISLSKLIDGIYKEVFSIETNSGVEKQDAKIIVTRNSFESGEKKSVENVEKLIDEMTDIFDKEPYVF